MIRINGFIDDIFLQFADRINQTKVNKIYIFYNNKFKY